MSAVCQLIDNIYYPFSVTKKKHKIYDPLGWVMMCLDFVLFGNKKLAKKMGWWLMWMRSEFNGMNFAHIWGTSWCVDCWGVAASLLRVAKEQNSTNQK